MTTWIMFQQNNLNYLLCPNPDSGMTLEQIAHKDVPPGAPYKFVSYEDFVVPNKDSYHTMSVDYSSPDGHGASWGVGTSNVVVGYNNDGSPVIEQGGYIPTPAEIQSNTQQS